MAVKLAAVAIVLSLPAIGFTLARAAAAADDPPLPPTTVTTTTTIIVESKHWHRRYEREHRRLALARRRVHGLKRTLMSTSRVTTAISLSCTIFGSCSTLRRKAWCESRFDARAQNASGAAGLFQFLPSTWRSTPFGGFSIFDPYANALAAGWMHARGRGGEWVCR